MFVQSAAFVSRHQRSPGSEISVYGQEKETETVRLCKMNLAVHGLAGDIRQANTYYENPHKSVVTFNPDPIKIMGRFDFVMANPPFNVNKVDRDQVKDDPRFRTLGLPTNDNAAGVPSLYLDG